MCITLNLVVAWQEPFQERYDFSLGCLGDKGTAAVASAIELDGGVHWIDLSRNGVRDAGAIAIAEAVTPVLSPAGM